MSKGETEIARVLWDIGPACVRDIHESISQSRTIELTTVQTYLRRLESKGYASSRLQGRARIYSAKARPSTVIRQTVDDFVERLFGGDAVPLVKHLIEDRGISVDDLRELKELIETLERSEDKP
ncbi:MAG: BlaI/MecI/CopY family transcriptional regulator [Pirellulaceae bacterium]